MPLDLSFVLTKKRAASGKTHLKSLKEKPRPEEKDTISSSVVSILTSGVNLVMGDDKKDQGDLDGKSSHVCLPDYLLKFGEGCLLISCM